jgi:hypothetical protein
MRLAFGMSFMKFTEVVRRIMSNSTYGYIALAFFLTSIFTMLLNKAFSKKDLNRIATNIATTLFLAACWVLCYAVVAATYHELEIGRVSAVSRAGGGVNLDRGEHGILFWSLMIIQIVGEAAILWIVSVVTMKFLNRLDDD